MKTHLLDINGNKIKEITLPSVFSEKIRKDIVQKVLYVKRKQQPYSPSLVAGKQHSAKGKLVHRRHVWRSGYGRGASRVPRKIFSQKGSQFNWEAAEVPQARGGMRAHPPRVISMMTHGKVNKKEAKIALASALSASASGKFISKKYETLEEKDVKHLPIITEGKITELKTKSLLESLKKILGDSVFNVSIRKKEVRVGRGKLRGRKYKSNAGLLIVLGENEVFKAKGIFDVANVKNLSVIDLAKGGLGRIVVYTENAIKYLENKFGGKK